MKPGGRRIRRWLFNGLALLSLLLAIAVTGLWVRSVWWLSDYIQVGSIMVASGGGNIGVGLLPGTNNLPFYSSHEPNATQWWPWYGGAEDRWVLAIPDWLLLLAFAPLGVWLTWRDAIGRRKQLQLGTCAHCGYDLRASKDRCPECGEPMPPSPVVPGGPTHSAAVALQAAADSEATP